MTPPTFRSPDEDAMVRAAWERAAAAHRQLTAVARQAMAANAARFAQGLAPLVVGEVSPPQVAPGTPALDVVRLLDGQTQWYAQESARLHMEIAATQRRAAAAQEPEASLGRGPRPVPVTLILAEVARGPWVWLRWFMFPPITMLGAVLIGGVATRSPLAAAAVLATLVTALWTWGVIAGLARARLLARGEVATVLQKSERFGATRNRNVPMLAARGWDVTVEFYSGMSKQTDLVVQTSRGVIGKVAVSHGPPYHGVALVDPDTGVGCTNLDLGSVPRPGPDGRWRASLPTRVWVTSALALVATAGLLGAALLLAMAAS